MTSLIFIYLYFCPYTVCLHFLNKCSYLYNVNAFVKKYFLHVIILILTDNVFPGPIQCAKIHPDPSSVWRRSILSAKHSHKNFTAERIIRYQNKYLNYKC